MIPMRLLGVGVALGITTIAAPAQPSRTDTLQLSGLREPVEVLRDRWGIAHIYAKNEHDLFFAQGYVAAKDRTFQFELWRRQATGTVAELLGARELKRDIGTRLFKFRGDLTRELNYYHPRGTAIIEAFVAGVNALVAEVERDSTLVPLELKLLGTKPGRWTPAVVISRHQGLLGNVTEELATGRAVAALGAAKVKEVNWYHPHEPKLDLDPKVDGKLLSADILGLYTAFRGPVRFQPSDLVLRYRSDSAAHRRLAHVSDSLADVAEWRERRDHERRDMGSNNWVVSGRKTASGYPIMANDPHRAISVPSLRYWVHLNAPGWNVIGGGEPVLPGVSIGHNEYGAWGLTIFSTDGEDLMVYETNPANPRQYRYQGRWEMMRSLSESIPVKGQAPVTAEFRYTRHGPVVYEDTANHVAYAVRAAWMDIGGAPYLASLRMDQAKSWEEFRQACAYSHIPGENMIWADKQGNIGWQAVGIAPVRRNFSGLVPVPGDGRYEWAGYLPMLQKPHAVNPPEGFIATANNNMTPATYPYLDAIGYTWADPYRYDRIVEVLRAGNKFTVADMGRLQHDYLSIPARQLVPLLGGVRGSSEASEQARQALLGWNFVLDASSVPAGIYEAWVEQLNDRVTALVLTSEARRLLRGVSIKRMIDWLSAPDSRFGADPAAGRDALLRESLDAAVAELTRRLGADMSAWRWGQERYHHVRIQHPMSAAVSEDVRRRLEVGPAPRGGDGNTVGVTGTGNQRGGASFRIIADAAAWDTAVGTNTPGQSGDPNSPHYRDLFEMWASDQYFPVAYSRQRVESVTESKTVLAPARLIKRASGR
jgi:penicillin G amidase